MGRKRKEFQSVSLGVTGFLDGDKARGHPVGVTLVPRGAIFIADDLSNTVWRVAPRR